MAEEIKVGEGNSVESSDKPESSTEKIEEVNSLEAEQTPSETEENGEQRAPAKKAESLESALKRFKRKCARAGVMAEIRRREHYEKPSVKRKKKAEAARKRKY